MPLPSDFATSGFCATRRDDHPLAQFQVLGERASGTNYVKRLIGRNTPLRATDALGWKHAVPHMLAIPRDLVVICVVRAADQWARSLFETPWHARPALQALEFSDFLRAPWDTHIDKAKHFEGLLLPASRGTALQYDRDPMTGGMFANIFGLRRAKLAGLLSMTGRDCACVVVRMEDVQRAPEDYLARITDALGVARHNRFAPVVKRQGWRFKSPLETRPPLPDAWSAADYAFLQAQVDPAQETALGYRYDTPPKMPKRAPGRAWEHDDQK